LSGDLDTIARFIAPSTGEPPSWLHAAVEKAMDTLAWTIQGEREYPTRKVLQSRLKGLASAIETVRQAMHDSVLAPLLLARDNLFLNQNETFHGLGDLAERVKIQLGKIPNRKGRDKFYGRPDGATPQQNCALMVRILWEFVHSAAPKPDDEQAQKACAGLWAAAGGPVTDHWSDRANPSTAVWRDHLRAARALDNSEEAMFLRRSLGPNAARTLATTEETELIHLIARLGGQSQL
jgi:hypothetical protein